MIIEIPDRLNGTERIAFIEKFLFDYAESHFKTRYEQAEFLGCSLRKVTMLRQKYHPVENIVTPEMIKKIKEKVPYYRGVNLKGLIYRINHKSDENAMRILELIRES